jgi:hypothetical protein
VGPNCPGIADSECLTGVKLDGVAGIKVVGVAVVVSGFGDAGTLDDSGVADDP